MSDTLSAINGVVNFITGQNPVVLGDFTFQSFEVPSRVQSGGSQRKTVHRYSGDQRTLDAMGFDAADVTWQGKLLGPDAGSRKTALEQICRAGEIVTLHWGTTEVSVLPHEMPFDEGFHETDYRVSCTVLPDPPDLAEPSPTQSLLGDVGDALGLDLTGALAAAQPYLATAQNVLQGVSGIIPGAGINLAVSSALGNVAAVSSGVSALANGNIGALAASFSGGQYSGLAQAAGLAANSSAVQAFAGRAINTVKSL